MRGGGPALPPGPPACGYAAGALTAAGHDAHGGVEQATDSAAAGPWARLGPAATAELARLLTPLARACASVLPYPSPIGIPAPDAAGIGGESAGPQVSL